MVYSQEAMPPISASESHSSLASYLAEYRNPWESRTQLGQS
jgi:hypothetical protein